MIFNFFESIIVIYVRICQDQMIELVYHDAVFYRGPQELALMQVKTIIDELSSLGEKNLVFNISNHRMATSQYESDKHYIGDRIKTMSKFTRCKISINIGLHGLIG